MTELACAGEGLRCSIPDLVTYRIRGSLIQHGCSVEQAEAVRVRPYGGNSIHPVLACVYVKDVDGHEREVHRVYDLQDLNDFVNSTVSCAALAGAVQKITKGAPR